MEALGTILQIKNAKAGVYSVKGASGFGFKKESDTPGSGSYTVRYRFAGRRPTMGLGAFSEISLADAREAARAAVALARRGINPIAERDRLRAENLAAERAKKPIVFEQMVESYLKTRKWRHKHARPNWLNPVKKFAYPVLAGLSLEEIAIAHIVAVIERAEMVSEETARRVLSRVGAALDAAIALSGKATRNPADVRLIEKIHPLRRHGPRPNFRRIELSAAPVRFQALQEAQPRAVGHSAVAIDGWLAMITCATRPSEALHAQWSEVDLDRRLWTIPAARTKSLREHVVPLSGVAIEVFARRLKARTGDAVFAVRSGSPINYSTFVRGLKAMGIDAGTPHSWRSIFRDWCGDVARIDRDLAEAALAHSLGATEASYRRQTAVEARRGPMEAYAKWLSGDAGADVIAFPAREALRLASAKRPPPGKERPFLSQRKREGASDA